MTDRKKEKIKTQSYNKPTAVAKELAEMNCKMQRGAPQSKTSKELAKERVQLDCQRQRGARVTALW
jgi:hypothetical protein